MEVVPKRGPCSRRRHALMQHQRTTGHALYHFVLVVACYLVP